MNIIASSGIDDNSAKQSLRVIGNSCIDTGSETGPGMVSPVDICSLDANRERIVARNIIPSIVAQLQTEPWLALPVLNNITTDYGRNYRTISKSL